MKKIIPLVMLLIMLLTAFSTAAADREVTSNDGKYIFRTKEMRLNSEEKQYEVDCDLFDAANGEYFGSCTFDWITSGNSQWDYIQLDSVEYLGFDEYRLNWEVCINDSKLMDEQYLDTSPLEKRPYTIKNAVESVIAELKDGLKRPKTFELRSLYAIYGVDENGVENYFFEMEYSAENSYGDTVKDQVTYYSCSTVTPHTGKWNGDHYEFSKWNIPSGAWYGNSIGLFDPKLSEEDMQQIEAMRDYLLSHGRHLNKEQIEANKGKIEY